MDNPGRPADFTMRSWLTDVAPVPVERSAISRSRLENTVSARHTHLTVGVGGEDESVK